MAISHVHLITVGDVVFDLRKIDRWMRYVPHNTSNEFVKAYMHSAPQPVVITMDIDAFNTLKLASLQATGG